MNTGEKKMVRLYHYLEPCWALDDIRQRRLKLSNFMDVNDPYEYACVYSTDPVTQKSLEEHKPGVSKLVGFNSFSPTCTNILLWSHYGQKHQGICLGFDVNSEHVRPVDYATDVQVIGPLSVQDLGCLVERLLYTKYKDWVYEQEIRARDEYPKLDLGTGLCFAYFDEDLILKEVIAGACCTVGRQDITDALEGYDHDVKVTKARANPETFELIIDEHGFEVD
jgi:hypothetical protein